MGKVFAMNRDEKQEAINVGVVKCPGCGENMRHLKSSFGKDEYYCSACHISKPLYPVAREGSHV